MPTILLVDNDRESIARLSSLLVDAGYLVITAHDGHAALAAIQPGRPDIVVLEWHLPGLDGLSVIRRLRETSSIPILMLATRDTVEDIVTALDGGADDYLVKPYNSVELLARLRALIRRIRGHGEHHTLTFCDLSLDVMTHEVRHGTRRIALSPREFALLTLLLNHPRQVLPREQIILAVWGYDFIGDPNILEVYIGYLRKKLEAHGEPRLIQTVRGVGYVLRSL